MNDGEHEIIWISRTLKKRVPGVLHCDVLSCLLSLLLFWFSIDAMQGCRRSHPAFSLADPDLLIAIGQSIRLEFIDSLHSLPQQQHNG